MDAITTLGELFGSLLEANVVLLEIKSVSISNMA